MKRIMAAGAVAAAALAACTACAGSSGAASPGSNTGSTTSAGATNVGTAAVTAPPTGTSGGAPSTTAVGGKTGTGAGGATTSGSGGGNGGSGLSTCSVRYLNGSVGRTEGTAGSVYMDVLFKNLDNKSCTLAGYPGVSFGAGAPVQQVGQPADRNSSVSPKTVTLAPGGYAYAVLQITDAGNYPASTCQPTATTYLQVYPPNTTNQLYIAYDSTACKGDVVTLHVEAVQAGTGG